MDSGADISIMSKKLYDKIKPQNIFNFSGNKERCIPLVSVTGHKLKNYGMASFLVQIHSFQQPYEFQIVDGLKNDLLLGNDFLSRFGVKLDFENKTLCIRNIMVPLRAQHVEHQISALVRTKQRVHIPAQTEIECPAYINRAEMVDRNCVIHALDNTPLLSEDPGLHVLDILAKPNRHRCVPVRIVNETNRAYTLNYGQVIAFAQSVEDSDLKDMELDDNTTVNLDNCSTTDENDDPLTKVNLEHLDFEHKTRVEEILRRNKDLFARNDAELGHVNLRAVCRLSPRPDPASGSSYGHSCAQHSRHGNHRDDCLPRSTQ